MKKLFLLITVSVLASVSYAQNENNLVPNSSFEEVDGKIKEGGQVTLARPWEAATMNPVDLYSEDAKDDEYSVPENKYGEEKARTGSNYVGLSFYGYRGREPRTYLTTELKEELKAGKQYCLKFHVSMSDRSKYAVNNIGMYISNSKVSEISDANIYLEPQIISVTNRIYEKQYSWEAICGVYTAEGGEKFITIGNFFTDDETDQETIRMSRGFSGRQMNDGYYYIDDISVIPTDKIGEKDCACEKIAGGQMKVEYKTFETDLSAKKEQKVKTKIVNSDGTMAEEKPKETKKEEGTEYKKFDSTSESEETEEAPKKEVYSPKNVVFYYDQLEFQTPQNEADIAKLISYMKENPKTVIQLEGHSDPSEAEVKFLGKRRALLLKKKLMDSGVDDSRLKYTAPEVKKPASKTDPTKNMRVTISVL